MTKMSFHLTLGAMLFTLCLPVEAQQAKKIARIGLVTQGSGADAVSYRADALRQGLRELGWIEGKNIIIEHRRTEGKAERSLALAADIVRLKVNVVVWSGGVQGAKQIKTIPVVYVATGDLVSTGLVESLARPGGNITGLSSLARELAANAGLLKETFVRISRVAYLFNPTEPAIAAELEQLRAPAAALGLTLRPVEARRAGYRWSRLRHDDPRTGRRTFHCGGAVNNTNRPRIVELAARNKLPAIYHTGRFVDSGGLMSYGPNLTDMFRRFAAYINQVLKITEPADLPVEQPTETRVHRRSESRQADGRNDPPNVWPGRKDSSQ